MNNTKTLFVVVMSLAIWTGYVMGSLITKSHYENVIQKLELQFQMSIDR